MDILTLELRDVTVFQALVELRSLLAEHPGEALRIVGQDETLRVNVAGFLERQGLKARATSRGGTWELELPAGRRPAPAPASPPPGPALRPVLLLRSAFAPGDRALGRRLLLETLGQVAPGTPWLCLAHQAVELLEDPVAVEVLDGVQARGIPVHVSLASLAQGDLDPGTFRVVPDAGWQGLLARGGLTVL
jgi:hypothetical protein